MTTRLLGILFLSLASCQQLEKTNALPPLQSDVVDSVSTVQKQIAEKKYSINEIYLTYLSSELLYYIAKTHPTWSVPDQNMWYPQLFNTYRTNHSLVNYVKGDFDGNGQVDHALIVDKGESNLAAVAFLGVGSSFKTVELTNLPPIEDVKINYHLTLYPAGRYAITDPDLAPADQKYVILKWSSVGVGTFKELYEGGDQVYYWEQNHLRSCVIEK